MWLITLPNELSIKIPKCGVHASKNVNCFWTYTLESWSASGPTVGSVFSSNFTWSLTSSGMASKIDFFKLRSCGSNNEFNWSFTLECATSRLVSERPNDDGLKLPLLCFSCTLITGCCTRIAVFPRWKQHKRERRGSTCHLMYHTYGSRCALVPNNLNVAVHRVECPCSILWTGSKAENWWPI